MICIRARNASEALAKGVSLILVQGEVEESRNGPVLVAPEPVATTYWAPEERVIFSPTRDAHPFFHLFEALWILAGRNDLAFLTQFLPRYADYSDDGIEVRGAYGYRWRKHFGFDQLEWAVEELRSNPKSRRVVLSMWDPGAENHNMTGIMPDGAPSGDPLAVEQGSRDVPCNTHIYLDRRNNHLNMTVCNRSNDAIWGAYGANVVQFSMLQEYLAAAVGDPVGEYVQFSNNLHIYTEAFSLDRLRLMAMEGDSSANRYRLGQVTRVPLVSVPERFMREVELFCEDPRGERHTFFEPFITRVALPLFEVWERRGEHYTIVKSLFDSMEPNVDWIVAAREWIERRHAAKVAKERA